MKPQQPHHDPTNKECYYLMEGAGGGWIEACTCPEPKEVCIHGYTQGFCAVKICIFSIPKEKLAYAEDEPKEILRDDMGIPVHSKGCTQSNIPYQFASCGCLLDVTLPSSAPKGVQPTEQWENEEIKRMVRNGADANTEPQTHGYDYLYRKETIDRLIDQALAKQREELREKVEGMRKDKVWYGNDDYNQALSDVLALLDKKEVDSQYFENNTPWS